MEITREIFDQQRRPRFGTANPERMHMAFWEWMIRGDDPPVQKPEGVLGEFGLMMRDGSLKSCHGPWRARDLLNVPANRDDGPIWTFDRMGATHIPLPDGRLVCIGGEHEDYYDPDFCIYNDVVILDSDGEIEIYGYPREVFPPIDFHTATLFGEQIILIGGLRYPDDRRSGHTDVYSVDLRDYRISRIATSGNMPGWIFKHEATDPFDGVITVTGGTVFDEPNGNPRYRTNVENYTLDLRTGMWRRASYRNWRQFSIRQQDSDFFVLEKYPDLGVLFPDDAVTDTSAGTAAHVVVDGVGVSITIGAREIHVIVECDQPVDLAHRLAEEIRSRTEAAIGHPCLLEEV